MTDIPPKQPVSGTASARVESAYGLPPLPHADRPPDIDATGALVSIHNAATQSGPDSFPVLKAFQEYLESERRSARRRVALISGLFAGIIVIVVAIFLTAGILLFNYMKDIQENLWRKLEGQPARSSGIPAAVGSAPAPVAAAQAGAWDAEMKKLGEAMTELKRDNEKLREKLAAPAPAPASVPVAVRPPAAAPKPAGLPASPVAARPAPAPAAAVAMPRPSSLEVPAGVAPPPPPEGYAESGVYLQPEGQGAPIPWRVLVPTR